MPELVPAADLASANALTSLSLNLGRVVGPALGAAIVALVGTGWAFTLNGVSFFAAALFIFPLLFTPFTRSQPQAATHPWQDFREGLAAVSSRPWLWISTLVFALTNITLAGPYSVAMPFLVKDFMHADVDVLGLLYAAFPLGYVVGGLWFGSREKIRRRGPLMYLSLALAAILLAFFGLRLPLWALLAAALVNGLALELEHLAWLSLLQEKIPNAQLGRVFSIDAIGSFALLPVGLALVGWGAETFGPQSMFLMGGGLTVVIALAVLALSPTVRRLD